MFIEYAKAQDNIPVKKVGNTFQAVNHALLLETQLRLKNVVEVEYEGRLIFVTRNAQNEIVET